MCRVHPETPRENPWTGKGSAANGFLGCYPAIPHWRMAPTRPGPGGCTAQPFSLIKWILSACGEKKVLGLWVIWTGTFNLPIHKASSVPHGNHCRRGDNSPPSPWRHFPCWKGWADRMRGKCKTRSPHRSWSCRELDWFSIDHVRVDEVDRARRNQGCNCQLDGVRKIKERQKAQRDSVSCQQGHGAGGGKMICRFRSSLSCTNTLLRQALNWG